VYVGSMFPIQAARYCGKAEGECCDCSVFYYKFPGTVTFFSHAILRGTVTSNKPNVDTPDDR
jgi:hypothetical protein